MSCWSNPTAVFIISIGSSRIQSVAAASDAIVYAAAQQFPDYELREVFLHRKTDTQTDPLQAALEQAVSEGIRTLVVQPAYLMHGYEYRKLKKVLGQYREKFRQIILGEPLLAGEADFKAVRNAAAGQCADYKDGGGTGWILEAGAGTGRLSGGLCYGRAWTDSGGTGDFCGTYPGSSGTAVVCSGAENGSDLNDREITQKGQRCLPDANVFILFGKSGAFYPLTAPATRLFCTCSLSSRYTITVGIVAIISPVPISPHFVV